jgi:hypothetical protein
MPWPAHCSREGTIKLGPASLPVEQAASGPRRCTLASSTEPTGKDAVPDGDGPDVLRSRKPQKGIQGQKQDPTRWPHPQDSRPSHLMTGQISCEKRMEPKPMRGSIKHGRLFFRPLGPSKRYGGQQQALNSSARPG